MTPDEKRKIDQFVQSISEEKASEVIKLILSALCDAPRNQLSQEPNHPAEKEVVL